jgi:O-antigen ligase
MVLSMNTKIANVLLLIIGVLVTIDAIRRKAKSCFTVKNVFNTTIFIVLLLLIGLIFTDDIGSTFKYFERYCSYLIIPILFSFLSLDQLIDLKKYSFRGLVTGSVLASLMLLCANFYKYFQFKQAFVFESDLFSYEFTYHEFASFLDIHPTFLGLYFVFAIVILNEYKIGINKVISFIANSILIVCLIFLNSRVPFLVFGIYLAGSFLRALYKLFCKRELSLKQVSLKVIPAIAILICVVIGFKDTYIYKRMSGQLVWELSENRGTTYDGVYSNDSRVSRWKVLIEKSFEKPLFGYGTGTEDRVSLEAYEEGGLKHALENRYGPHNQYISFLLEFGLLGLLVFSFYLGINLLNEIRQRNFVSTLFIVFMTVSYFFDSLMYLNAGVIFFAFFANLFTVISINKSKVKAC